MKKKILTGRAARISPTGVGRCGGAAVSVRKSNQGVSSASMKAKKMMTLATMKRKRGTKMEKLESTSDVCAASNWGIRLTIKTDADLGQDQERLAKIKDFRKLHADTTINTTHFIKKAVMVPLDLDEEGQP